MVSLLPLSSGGTNIDACDVHSVTWRIRKFKPEFLQFVKLHSRVGTAMSRQVFIPYYMEFMARFLRYVSAHDIFILDFDCLCSLTGNLAVSFS